MTTYIALLRAVNVGGTGKLPMAELKSLCNQLGWQGVETYIASGNVPPRDALRDVRGQHGEELSVGRREIYVFYPDGMGRSKLVIPVARSGTARNLRTIAKLVELCARRA